MNMNYQKKMDELIGEWKEAGRVPSLLLHSCCAPCSSYVLEYLSEHFLITDFFYNPNITSQEEYGKRMEEMRRLVNEMKMKYPVALLAGDYHPEEFLDRVRGLEQEKEGGARCAVCYELRLEEAAKLAKERNLDYFATTLTISPLKNAEKINNIGFSLEQKYGVKYLPSDFKKKEGYKRSIELSKEYNLYRQQFCGCGFSKAEAEHKEVLP